jgi:hypothetical protein
LTYPSLAPTRDRSWSDGLALLSGNAGGDEFDDLHTGPEEAERAVTGFRDLHGELHDALEYRWEGEFGGDRQTRLDQQILASFRLGHARAGG